MSIFDIKSNSFTVEWLKFLATGVVDKHELANLFTVNTLPESKTYQFHIWKETDEETICVELATMVFTHNHAIAWIMMRCTFSLIGNPTALFEVPPIITL